MADVRLSVRNGWKADVWTYTRWIDLTWSEKGLSMSSPSHLPDEAFFARFEKPTREKPMPMLVSGCLAGRLCGFDGTSYGTHSHLQPLLHSPLIRAVSFCPEEHAFGTPRSLCDIHGGNGFDVLDGRARVLTSDGEDWTEQMIAAACRMAALARERNVELALLMDISAACGSQVIYNGSRLAAHPVYQAGQGVAAAALIRQGVRVLCQRDFGSLRAPFGWLGISWAGTGTARDHHQTDWYRENFGKVA